jgi:hypothetical protein
MGPQLRSSAKLGSLMGSIFASEALMQPASYIM